VVQNTLYASLINILQQHTLFTENIKLLINFWVVRALKTETESTGNNAKSENEASTAMRIDSVVIRVMTRHFRPEVGIYLPDYTVS
jgi:hypothetical protein